MKVKKLKHEEGPSMGAAMLAAYGLGWFESVADCVETFIKVEEVLNLMPKIINDTNNSIMFINESISKRKN